MPTTDADDGNSRRVDAADVRDIIEEFFRWRRAGVSQQAALAEAALFVEQAFAIRLVDADIDADTLGGVDAMTAFVIGRIGDSR
jgi:hypothetical protein